MLFHKLALKTSTMNRSKYHQYEILTRISTVTIACIVHHHYHVFHVPRRFYLVNKSCSIVF